MGAGVAEETTNEGVTSSSELGASRTLVGQKLGRYEILCELASGGMAAVYIARAQGVAGFERLVAIKVMHPHLAHEEEFISMFLDEARLAARIRHPNVVATQDVIDSGGDGFFIVMDYVAGDHLGTMLGAVAALRRTIPPMVVARIVTDALNGLAAAHDLVDEDGHRLNIVHRDISPHNILVGVEGVARLTDFGVAKAEARLASTRDGQFKGKLAYVSPEQASSGKCDHRSDLFAMGIVLWEALTSRRLFRCETGEATLKRLTTEPIPMPSQVKASLAPWDKVLARALERDPEKRFQTAYEFVEAIEEVARDCGGLATPRTLAAALRELAGDKIEEEKRKVKTAIAMAGGSGYATLTRIPIPSSGTPGMIAAAASNPRIASGNPDVMTSGEFATHTVLVQEVTAKTSVMLIVALLAVAAAAGIGGYIVRNNQRDPAPQTIVVRSTTPPSPSMAQAPSAPATSAGAGTDQPPNTSTDATDERTRAQTRRAHRRHSLEPVILERNPYHEY